MHNTTSSVFWSLWKILYDFAALGLEYENFIPIPKLGILLVICILLGALIISRHYQRCFVMNNEEEEEDDHIPFGINLLASA